MGFVKRIVFFCSVAFLICFLFSSGLFSEILQRDVSQEKIKKKILQVAVFQADSPKNTTIEDSEKNRTTNPRLYQEAQTAMIQEKYELAVEKFHEISELEPKNALVWYWLGVSLLRLSRFEESQSALLTASKMDPELSFVKEKREYYRFLTEARDALESLKFLEETKEEEREQKKELVFLYALFSIVGFILIVGLVVWVILKRKKIRRYKQHSISEDLLSDLNFLNQEFRRAKQMLEKELESKKPSKSKTKISTFHSKSKKSSWLKMQFRLEEAEERCISLNERLEENRYGLIRLNEEAFKDEIHITRKMLSAIFVEEEKEKKKNADQKILNKISKKEEKEEGKKIQRKKKRKKRTPQKN